MNITEFLLQRIAEDEAVARAAIETVTPDSWENPTEYGNYYPEDVTLWNRFTPARALAECAAKRAIVELHPVYTYTDEEPGYSQELNDHVCPMGQPEGGLGPCKTLRHLATVYADHDDYQTEWNKEQR